MRRRRSVGDWGLRLGGTCRGRRVRSEAHASTPLSPQPKGKSSAFLAEGVGILRGSGGSSVRGAGVGREPDRALTKMVKRALNKIVAHV